MLPICNCDLWEEFAHQSHLQNGTVWVCSWVTYTRAFIYRFTVSYIVTICNLQKRLNCFDPRQSQKNAFKGYSIKWYLVAADDTGKDDSLLELYKWKTYAELLWSPSSSCSSSFSKTLTILSVGKSVMKIMDYHTKSFLMI